MNYSVKPNGYNAKKFAFYHGKEYPNFHEPFRKRRRPRRGRLLLRCQIRSSPADQEDQKNL